MAATIVLRNVKGSALTTAELDGNFSNLNSWTNTVDANVGVLSRLNTTSSNTSNLVSAINEVNANTGVAAAVYGNALNIPALTINDKGKVTNASNVSIGTLALTNPYHPNVKFTGNVTETVYPLSTSSIIQSTNGTILTRAVTGTTNFTDGLTSGQSVTMILYGGASYTVTWPSITWISSSGNLAPTLTAKDSFVFFKENSNLFGIYVGKFT